VSVLLERGETLDAALAGQTFDLAAVIYGRVRLVAMSWWAKTPRVVAVGGVASYRGYFDPAALPTVSPWALKADAGLRQSHGDPPAEVRTDGNSVNQSQGWNRTRTDSSTSSQQISAPPPARVIVPRQSSARPS
jgi:hypothetical protein